MVSLHCPPSPAPGVQGSRLLFSAQLLLAAPPIAGLLPAHVPSSSVPFTQPDTAQPEPQSMVDAEAFFFAGFAQLPPAQREAAHTAAQALLEAACSYLLQDMRQLDFLYNGKRFIQMMLHLNGKALPPGQELIRTEHKRSAEYEKLRLDMADTDLKLARVIINQFTLFNAERKPTSGGGHAKLD